MIEPAPVTERTLQDMASAAWRVRENAHVIGTTRVGCAVLTERGDSVTGCNVEHRYRCHDVHAEVNAITTMIAQGGKKLKAIVIVAEREHFTPCGGCMDWIFQFASEDCVVAFQSQVGGRIVAYSPKELMPYYPR